MKSFQLLLLCTLAACGIAQVLDVSEWSEGPVEGRRVNYIAFTNHGPHEYNFALNAHLKPGQLPSCRLSTTHFSTQQFAVTSVVVYAGTYKIELPNLEEESTDDGRRMEYAFRNLTGGEFQKLCASELFTVHFRGEKGNAEVPFNLKGSAAKFFRTTTNAAFQVAGGIPLRPQELPSTIPYSASAGPEIVTATWKVTEKNETWWRVAYQVQVRNNAQNQTRRTIDVKFLDAEGFEIDDKQIYGVVVPSGETRTFTGSALIKIPSAANVKSIKAEFAP